MKSTVTQTNLGLPNRRQGKVRDLYDVPLENGDLGLLVVATDRISAFDVVLGTGLPGKGVVLTQLSKFWFDFFGKSFTNHLISTEVDEVPGLSDAERTLIRDRIMLCRGCKVLPVECIVRGYITGSGYKDYLNSGKVCGIELPDGLSNSDKLSEPLFTPSTKAEIGLHDENITFEQGCEIVGTETMSWLRDSALKLYSTASEHAQSNGIILADTKFEFGTIDGEDHPLLIDEIFTPDSSRFWPADEWEPGREQKSFDKQIVRNYLETVVSSGEWDKTPPGPELPKEIVEAASKRYLEAFELLTGTSLNIS